MITAQAIVRRDRSGPDTHAHAEELEKLATGAGFVLQGDRALVIDSDAGLPRLLALGTVDAVVVRTLGDVPGWLDYLRTESEVWTLQPRHRWPRRPVAEETRQLSEHR
ncbi:MULTISPECIES: hypothetical protein [unclassified Nocardia]|uniref:hypothetical protein n=1 Tax=unclassified Nocardia TaxID=2637762 RepID=UPI001CE3DE7E|nr:MULTISPECIES: hypothetical protein [unclassified Nocardia]